MKREQHYTCPDCRATKTIVDIHGQQSFPASVPCGWRGCTGEAIIRPPASTEEYLADENARRAEQLDRPLPWLDR